MNDKDYRLKNIEIIRRDNNRLWMGILTIALEKAPEETKILLRGIYDNDSLVAGLLKEIADD